MSLDCSDDKKNSKKNSIKSKWWSTNMILVERAKFNNESFSLRSLFNWSLIPSTNSERKVSWEFDSHWQLKWNLDVMVPASKKLINVVLLK